MFIRVSVGILALVVAACGDGETTDSPATTMGPPPSSTTTTVPLDCGLATVDIDLDGDGTAEQAYAIPGDDASLLVVCTGGSPTPLEVDGGGLELVGPFDVDGDTTPDLLFTRDTRKGLELGAVAATPQGPAVTGVGVERWSDLGEADAPPFEGSSYQCVDWDGDGTAELVQWRYRPAGTGQVTVTVSVIGLDGMEETVTEVDEYVTSSDEADAVWQTPDGCAGA